MEPLTRRRFAPGDALRAGIGAVVVAVGTVVGHLARSTIGGAEEDLLRLAGRLPDSVEDLLIGTAQLVVRVVPLVVMVALLVRRRWRLAGLLLLTGALGAAAMAGMQLWGFGRTLAELEAIARERRADGLNFAPDSATVASMTASVTLAGPWVARRWKRVLWAMVAVTVVLRLMSTTDPAFDVVVALGVGSLVGSLVLLVTGSPSVAPGVAEIAVALADLGLAPRDVTRLDRVGTAHRYRFLDGRGRSLEVRARTPDEREADLLARTGKRLRLLGSEVDPGYARVDRRVEHEALALVLAERADLATPRFVALGATPAGAAFLVTGAGHDRAVAESDLHDRAFLVALWELVGGLHDAGIAHRHLHLAALGVGSDGRPHLSDFDRADLAPTRRDRSRDVATLLVETAAVTGPSEAVSVAVEVLGSDPVAAVVPLLQPLALPSATRTRAKGVPDLLSDLRDEVLRATGAEDVPLERLERIRPRTAVVVVASSLAFYSLLPQLANLGATVESFAEARPLWLVGAAVASALTYVFAAISFQGSVAQALPAAANLRAQVAASFAGLVGPAGAGGFALTGRFLQRNGLEPAESAASVSINGAAGVAVHLLLTAGFFSWAGRTDASGTSGLAGISLPAGSTILLVLAVVLALVGALLAVGPVRTKVVGPAVAAIRTATAQFSAVLRRPSRVIALLGGSAAISLAYVAAAAAAVAAFGGTLSFAQVGTAYLAASALASVSPTPGGLGALEAALVATLTGFGMANGPAVAAVLTFRLATFWLPILPGWVAFTWMQRHDEL